MVKWRLKMEHKILGEASSKPVYHKSHSPPFKYRHSKYIVKWWLKARIVEQLRTAIDRQQRNKNASTATNMQQ
jgi:hypothetical protein